MSAAALAFGLSSLALAWPAQNNILGPGATGPAPRIEFRVFDAGKTLQGLGPLDFDLRINGTQRRISDVRYGSADLDTVLLLDASVEFASSIRDIEWVIQSGLRGMSRGERLGIMLFFGRCVPNRSFFELLLPLTSDRDEIELALGRLRPSPYKVKDASAAIRRAATHMLHQGRHGARKHILLVTSALNTPNVPAERLIPLLREADTVLDAVLLPVRADVLAERVSRSPQHPKARTKADIFTFDVRPVIYATGGVEMVTTHTVAAFEEMWRDLRERYAIAYEPEPGERGAPAQIDVTLSADARRMHPQATIEARGFRRERSDLATQSSTRELKRQERR